MNKTIGYMLSGIGLIGILLSSGKLKQSIPAIANTSPLTIIIPSLVLVAIGVILMILDNKGPKSKKSRELPIYEGKGKKRKVVAYQREK